MNHIPGKRKGGSGRTGPGRRINRSHETKAPVVDGVYTNSRLIHTATSLVGCQVQVTVKNGGIYEGIFVTFSPKMDVVLQVAHKVDDSANGRNAIPNKERLLEKVIFNLNDVVVISGLDVDLDYASKDSFTDAGISKFNGQIVEKELTPWEADLHNDDAALEETTNTESNGWDANEMFERNEMKFNVTSTYDPSLSQYTTPLNKQDTVEYREREKRAQILANEIEQSDNFVKGMALEDDDDEENAFSAVSRSATDSNGITPGGKYVPPHLRRNPQHGRVRCSQSPGSPQTGASPASPLPEDAAYVDAQNVGVEDKELSKSECVGSGAATVSVADVSSKDASKKPQKTSSEKKRKEINELKEFGETFKLSNNEPKKSPTSPKQPSPVSADEASIENINELKKEDPDNKAGVEVKKSTLNPEAKEFVFNPNAKPFTPQPIIASVTPPRPNQSPGIQPMIHHGMPPPPQIFNGPYMVPMSMAAPMVQAGQQFPRAPPQPRRAVVSVQQRPDQAVAAATGQPLLQNPIHGAAQQSYPINHPYVQQSMGAATAQVFPQMVQMQAGGAPQRMMSMQHQQQQHAALAAMAEQIQPSMISYTVQQGTNLGHLSQGGAAPPGNNPAHITHQATPPLTSQQPSHMAHPAAASPIQQQQQQHQQQQQQQQQQPPSSGTPQPSYMFNHNMAAGQPPPLQPSPHTPTSPQYPPLVPLTYTSQPGQMSIGYSYSNQHQQHSTQVTHAQHTQHSHVPTQHQFVMMPGANAPPPHPIQGHHMQLAAAAAAAAAAGHNPPQMQAFTHTQ